MKLEETNVIAFPSINFQGEEEAPNPDRLLRELAFLAKHPKIFKMLLHTKQIIYEGYKNELNEILHEKENCIIPLKRKSKDVVIIEPDNEYYKDYLLTLEKYRKYRERRVKDHLAIKRAFKVNGA